MHLHIFTLTVPKNRIKTRSYIDSVRDHHTHRMSGQCFESCKKLQNLRHLLRSHWEDGGAHRLVQEEDAEEMDSILHRTTFVTLDKDTQEQTFQRAQSPCVLFGF